MTGDRTPNALTLCNCCEHRDAHPACAAGYCVPCWTAAIRSEPCDHDQEEATGS